MRVSVPDRTLMQIREFSARSGLTQKALRLYDQNGLLPPSYINPESHYRYYLPELLARARRIILLRRLEMPLVLIGQILDVSAADALVMIKQFWLKLQSQHEAQQALFLQLVELYGG